MMACSGSHMDSNPSASHLRATSTGPAVNDATNASTPIFMITSARRISRGRRYIYRESERRGQPTIIARRLQSDSERPMLQLSLERARRHHQRRGAERRYHQCSEEMMGMDAEGGKQPSSHHAADQPEQDVGEHAEAFAANEFAREPSRNKSDQNRSDHYRILSACTDPPQRLATAIQESKSLAMAMGHRRTAISQTRSCPPRSENAASTPQEAPRGHCGIIGENPDVAPGYFQPKKSLA